MPIDSPPPPALVHYASEQVPPHPPTPKATVADAPPAQPHLLGDWLGLRTWLEDKGIKPTATYIWFPAVNLNGGTREKVQQAGQFAASLAFDLDRLAGIKGGTIQAAVTNRNGQNINDTNHLGLLQYPQGVYGAGQIWRMAGLWYQQRIGSAELKVGQVSMGEDFGSTTCFFQSLYFCGVVPGHTSFNYWYNYPITTWGGRVKIRDKLGYTMAGVYQRNDNKFPLNRGFYLGWKGGKGAFVAIERGFDVKLGGDPKRVGLYKIGIFFDTSKGNDLIRDENGGLAAMTGDPLDQHRGRASFYAVARQQIIGAKDDGSGGLTAFANIVQADRRTNFLRNVVTAGATYSGIVAGRPRDEIGIAVGRSLVNDRAAELREALNVRDGTAIEPQRDEYAIEATYSIAVRPGLSVRPNIQYYVDSGGRDHGNDVVVLGTGVFAAF